MPKRSSRAGEAVVLAVVAVALGVGEDDDAVGLEGGERVLDRLTAGSLSPVSPAASTPSSSRRSTVSSWARVGLGDRLVGVGDPERDLGAVAGGGDDEHLGALDLVAEGGAQGVGVDGLGGDDEQLHAGWASPGPGWSNGVERSTTTATSSRRRPSWTSSALRSTASAIAPASRPPQPAQQLGEPLRARARRRTGWPRRRRRCRARARRRRRAARAPRRSPARGRSRAACRARPPARPRRRRAAPAAAGARRWRARPRSRPGRGVTDA